MRSFDFTSAFLTGLPEVDEQHRKLVDLINSFGETLASMDRDHGDLEAVFAELAEYTRHHFTEEEALMASFAVDPRHVQQHLADHGSFLEDMVQLYEETAADDQARSEQLLRFLTNWLAYHILGSDKELAAQIEKIETGQTPAEAFDEVHSPVGDSTEPLLNAINELFQLVSARNQELRQLNESLEQQVDERTRELRDANEHLARISLTDALTQLPNRRHAMQSLADHWGESTDLFKPFSVLMIDADHFKAVNDTHGHDAGDRVLCELARELRHSVRTDDLVCRLGGDEFFVICPATDEAGGLHIAHQIVANVAQLRVATGDGHWHGSVSVGVATRTANMEGFEELIKEADDGVYAAKRAGKGCVGRRSEP